MNLYSLKDRLAKTMHPWHWTNYYKTLPVKRGMQDSTSNKANMYIVQINDNTAFFPFFSRSLYIIKLICGSLPWLVASSTWNESLRTLRKGWVLHWDKKRQSHHIPRRIYNNKSYFVFDLKMCIVGTFIVRPYPSFYMCRRCVAGNLCWCD